MQIPDDCVYTPEHEWARREDEVVTIGLTAHAVEQLGGITFIDLPDEDDELAQGTPLGEVESVKAVSDIYTPVSGTVLETNRALEQNPEKVDNDPYGDGWLCRVRLSDPAELEQLMSPDQYSEYIQEE
ncbi:MAG: glycine cleavage system protein GcvH [Planctomycetota bacterium]